MRQVALFLLIIPLSLLVGCESMGTYSKSYKVLSGSKVTMETLGTTAKQLHVQGVLNDEQIAKAKQAYESAQAVQREFIAMQVAAISSGDTTTQAQIAAMGVSYLVAASKFINIAISYGLIKADDPAIKTLQVKE